MFRANLMITYVLANAFSQLSFGSPNSTASTRNHVGIAYAQTITVNPSIPLALLSQNRGAYTTAHAGLRYPLSEKHRNADRDDFLLCCRSQLHGFLKFVGPSSKE